MAMGAETNSNTVSTATSSKKAKVQEEKKTAIQQNTPVIKYVPSNMRQEALKYLLCSLTMPLT